MKNEFGENFEKGWEKKDERRQGFRLELESEVDDIRIAAKDSGLDWSDVTVKSVDDSKLRAPTFGSVKSAGRESGPKTGTLEVTVTSKGEDYRILIRTHYSPSGGWYIRSPPRWAGP